MDLKNVWETASWLQCQGYIYRITTLAMILKENLLRDILQNHGEHAHQEQAGDILAHQSYNDTMTACQTAISLKGSNHLVAISCLLGKHLYSSLVVIPCELALPLVVFVFATGSLLCTHCQILLTTVC